MTIFFITGAGRGIGREMTRQALANGDTVVGTVRAGSEAVLDDLKADAGGRLSVLTMDVNDPASIAETAAGFDGSVDVLVCNAGIIGGKPQSVLEMDFDAFAETLAVNTLGPLRDSIISGKANPARVVLFGDGATESNETIEFLGERVAVTKSTTDGHATARAQPSGGPASPRIVGRQDFSDFGPAHGTRVGKRSSTNLSENSVDHFREVGLLGFADGHVALVKEQRWDGEFGHDENVELNGWTTIRYHDLEGVVYGGWIGSSGLDF